MRGALAALPLAVALAAPAAATARVRRGDAALRIKVSGTVTPAGVFRLTSPIDGRVESVAASSGSWARARAPLAQLARRELAAMLDAKGAQDAQGIEERWKGVFRFSPVSCAVDCYVLRAYARPAEWVKPRQAMFDAARALTLVGRVRPQDVRLVRDGMALTFWARRDPSRVLSARVERLRRSEEDDGAPPGATFAVSLGPDLWLDPGTEWDGEVVSLRRRGVLLAPTAALIREGGRVYLPVRVSTGLTTDEATEITAGVEDGREILVLDDAQLRGAQRHARPADLSLPGAPPPAPAQRPIEILDTPAGQRRSPEDQDDPYGQQ